MNVKISIFKTGVFFVFVSLISFSCTKNLTTVTTVYENNFEGTDDGALEVLGWSNGLFTLSTERRIFKYNGQTVLGKLNNNIVQLILTGLPRHQLIRISMNLYLHNNWNNDLWRAGIDGENRLITGFSNNKAVMQSYPNWLNNGMPLRPAGNEAAEVNLPGVCQSGTNSNLSTSMYKIVMTVPHSGNEVTIQYGDAGGAVNDTCNRSWSIDNLKVSVLRN